MATRESNDEVKEVAKSATESTGAPPKVVWDDAQMKTAYVNVCNVLGTREEITLLFGTNQAWPGGQKEVRVLLSNRIVLNPYAAKRLLQLLQQGVKEYEGRYGELKT